MAYEFNMLYYTNIYKKYWRLIIIVVALSMFVTMVRSRSKPPIYVSTVTLLTADTGKASTGVLEQFFGAGFADISGGPPISALLYSKRMAKDIRDQFNLDEKPRFWYSIWSYKAEGIFAVEVKGSDPALTGKIANFAVVNLDKLNTELDITPKKPMVKVLDKATYGSPESRQIAKKVVVAGIFAFLGTSLCAFFSDYLRKLKQRKYNIQQLGIFLLM